ncbi:unnamed protein product [Brassica napus]|uniref:(rape) hypothetical protein n=1 Tax=Brassica napus TaxID=3708 RepID=A0A816ZIF1_BRANA|nr:unnamed protein product [Brassica napus]
MNLCYKVHSSESCLSVLQEHSLAIEFNWFWFHSCKEFEAISMVRVLQHIASVPEDAWNCVSDSENPTCAVMKHTNPCGEAYRLALIADPGSTFGGIVAANVKVDKGFFATKRKDIYCVTDHKLSICFTQNIVLSELQYNPVVIERNMFRFRSFQEFEGYHRPMKASHESHNRFNESLATLAVVLVTAVNTKHIGGTVLRYLSTTMSQALELIDNYFEANGDIGANHEMPTPQCLVEISSSNLTVKRHTIIVTKVVCPAVLPPFVVAKSQPDAIDEESTCSWINSFMS